MFKHELYVHGIRLTLKTDMPDVASDFKHDFAYFLTQDSPFSEKKEFIISHFSNQTCPWSPIPSSGKRRSKHAWALGNYVRLCMFGKAQVEYDFTNKYCNIYSSDRDISYEIVYLVTLSYLGEAMDRRGWHRIHGFGFVIHEIGGILLAPSGGGKSTLAMELLKKQRAKILSDDTPVITKEGNMLAFPQRIALKDSPDIQPKHYRQFKRFKFGNKFVVGADFFNPSIAPEAEIQWLILSNKKKSENAKIRQISRFFLIWPLIKWLVIGYETPQIWEFFVRPSVCDIVSKANILFSRAGTSLGILTKVKLALFTFSEDPVNSATVFEDFFKTRSIMGKTR